jgi:amyloid beta precursor protein binding protein 1
MMGNGVLAMCVSTFRVCVVMDFAVDWESTGQSKAKSVCALLQELNESVGAKFVEESPEALLESNPAFFAQFTLVIATQVTIH